MRSSGSFISSNASSEPDEYRERTETKEDGRFEIRLPASDGRTYSLMAHDGSKFRTDRESRRADNPFDRYEWRTWANGVGPTLETTAGQQIDNIELRLTRPGAIRGRLVDKAGKPVARSPVHCIAVDNREGPYHHPIGRTDGEGRFEIRFVRPGRHQILGGRTNGLPSIDASHASLPIVEVQAGETVDAGDVPDTH